ncbi:MAG: hypothetical protein A4E65_02760 [Syntrophorhabdus sp. PtaU1.Bin153]|nr:MAG: hypothetical protein A4E65_02760 [Syntrophorhabdus sp. PtaU1.Bin153]
MNLLDVVIIGLPSYNAVKQGLIPVYNKVVID